MGHIIREVNSTALQQCVMTQRLQTVIINVNLPLDN